MEAFLIPGLILRRKPDRWKWKEYESKSLSMLPPPWICVFYWDPLLLLSPFTMATPHFSQLGVHDSTRLIPRWPGVNKHTSWVFWGPWHTEDLTKTCFLEDGLSWCMYTHIYVLHWCMCTHIYVPHWWICTHIYVLCWCLCTHIYVLHWCMCTNIYAHRNHLQSIRPLEKLTNSFGKQWPKGGVITCKFFHYAQNRASMHWLVQTIEF